MSTSTWTFDSLVSRSTVGGAGHRASSRRAGCAQRRQCVPECCHLLGRADRDAQPAVRPDLADQHAAVEQALPDGVPVGVPPEQHEVRVALGHLEPQPGQPAGRRVALGPQVVDPGEQLVGVPQRGERGGLGDGAEVVRQPHHPDRVADLRRRREVPEPGAGERERLAHRPRHDEVAQRRQQLERARRPGAAELGVRLVDHDQRRRRPPRTGPRRWRAAAPCRSGCWATAAAPRWVARAARARGRRPGRARSRPRGDPRPSGCRCRGRTPGTSSTSARS